MKVGRELQKRVGFEVKNGAGFTLIEVLIVIGIFALVAGIALFVSMDSFRGYGFRSERDALVGILQKARSQAISNVCLGACGGNDGEKHGVHFDLAGKKYVIFQTTANYTTGRDASADQVVPINNDAVSFTPSPPPDIIFNQLTGEASDQTAAPCAPANCTIILTQGLSTAAIQINGEGRIDTP